MPQTDTSRKGKGRGKRKLSGRGSKDHTQSDDSEEISRLKKQLKQAKAQIKCPREKKTLDCDTSAHSHQQHQHYAKSNTKGKRRRSDSDEKTDKKKKDSSGEKSDQAANQNWVLVMRSHKKGIAFANLTALTPMRNMSRARFHTL
jgi:hypothetical protein